MSNTFFVILIIVAVCFISYYIHKNFKFPKMNCLTLIDGGVKTGKSTMAVAFAIRRYKQEHRRWKIACFFCKLFSKPFPEEPHIYSNIPLNMKYIPLTKDLLLRKKRFFYKSVIYVNEASLLADSMLFKNAELNERLQFFNKLIGHELKSGLIIYDTQAVSDLHFSIKRCLSEYFYIHHLVKWIPFFLVAYVRETRYSDDGSVISVDTQDVEDTLKRVIIPKSVWKKFDAYAFSSLTDDLPIEDTVIDGTQLPNLKIQKIVSFRKFITLDKEVYEDNEEENS